jgi:rubrerythrin
MVEIQASYPRGRHRLHPRQPKAAAGGEHEEWTELYPEFARIAREEGFEQIAVLWDKVCIAEKQHEKRYNDL